MKREFFVIFFTSMKNLYSWQLLLLFLPLTLHSQQDRQVRYDSLEVLWKRGDINQYYKFLDRQIRFAAETLHIKQELDQLTAYLFPDPAIKDVNRRYLIRKAASVFGSKYYRTFGDLKNAEMYYMIGHHHATDSILLDDYAWYCENDLMNIYNMRDDYEKAEYFLTLVDNSLQHQIRARTNAKASGQYSRLLVNKGLLFESRADTLGAIACYSLGLKLADSLGVATAIQSNACALANMMMDLDSMDYASHLLQKAESVIDLLENELTFNERLAEILLQQAKWKFKSACNTVNRHDQINALEGYEEAISLLASHHHFQKRREIAKYQVEFAQALIELDSLEVAKSVLQQALGNLVPDPVPVDLLLSFDDLYHENTFIQIYEAYADIVGRQYEKTNQDSFLYTSIEALDRAIYVNDIILDQVAADPSKLIAVRTNKKLVHRELDAVYTLYQKTREFQYLQKARDLFTRSKSLLLEEKIRQSHAVAHLTAEEQKTLRDWQEKLRRAYANQLDTTYRQDSLSRVIFTLKKDISELLAAKEGPWKQDLISGSYIEYAVFGEEVMVCFHIDQMMGWTKLGPKKKLDQLTSALNYYLSTPMEEDDQVLSDLYKYLITPLTGYLPKHLTVIPDGMIGLIPFDILKDHEGRMLIHDHTIQYAHAYTTYVDTTLQESSRNEICLLAPSYGDGGAMVSAARGSLYPLKNTQMEIDSIARLYGGRASKPAINDDQTFLDSIATASIFHFAGHAIVNGDKAYLALSAVDQPDQQLTLEELATLKRGPALVVLSACETGLGRFDVGEGIRSLGRSFAEAGTKASVISLWNVSDRSTPRIMISFYKHLLAGNSVAEALRNAKLEYISVSEDGMEHPYYWAGFVATGG
jgi:CHAT domain-containing protein